MKVSEFQALIKELYFEKDKRRGIQGTFLWFIEETGELATLLNKKESNTKKISEELADIIAWTSSIANLLNIDLEQALFKKYPKYCRKCGCNPCECLTK